MSGFSIRNPFFIITACLMVTIVGLASLARMPVDLFPPIQIPVVVVATFYSMDRVRYRLQREIPEMDFFSPRGPGKPSFESKPPKNAWLTCETESRAMCVPAGSTRIPHTSVWM